MLTQQTTMTKAYHIDDFDMIDSLGQGNFGVVKLVKKKGANEYYALKIIKKDEINKSKQIEHIKRERDILIKLSKWCPDF